MPAIHPVLELFEQCYAKPAQICSRAPGRVNLIGEHVDYQGGLVMPAAIDRYISAAAAPIEAAEVRLWSSLVKGSPLVVPLEQTAPLQGDGSWANYAFGVVAAYRDAGYPVSGFEIAFDADLPLGAGMSSSAALESASALVVEALANIQLPPQDRALLCQAAEHTFAGVPCGIMDQLAVNCGIAAHALHIDCRTLDIRPARLPDDLAIVVVDSKVKHALADGEYAKRKADCETAAEMLGMTQLRDATLQQVDAARDHLGERVHRRARHVVTEIERVRQFSDALDNGEMSRVSELMAASHRSLRDDYEVSCPELDSLVGIAASLGAIGSRMMGGGFGGSTINLVAESEAGSLANAIVRRYFENCGKEVEAFVVHAVSGADTPAFPNSSTV